MHTRSTMWLALAVTMTGVLGSGASISAGWGWVGILLSIVLAVVILALCLISLRPVMQRNDRGVTLLHAVNSVGMVDIENREDTAAPLPPHQFYERAMHEIVITGISAYRTFDQHLDVLKHCLRLGKKVFVLILRPDSPALAELSRLEKKDVAADIHEVLRVMKLAKLNEHAGFAVRFRETLPPFTGVMIDGDLVPTGEHARDENGQIRVQPVSPHRSQHRGIVLQLRKKQGPPVGTFDFFADDLRSQWAKDAREDKGLFS